MWGRCAFESIKRNPLLSQIATGRSRYLGSHSSLEGSWVLTREWKVIMKLKLTMGRPVTQSPGQSLLPFYICRLHCASRHHESPAMNWILARNILESVAESRIVFHIRIVRRPPPPYFRQDYLSHRVLSKLWEWMWTCRFSDKQRTIKFYNWHVKQEAFYKVVPIERSGVILIWGAAWSLLCLLTSPYTSLPSVTAQAGPGEIPRLQSSISLCSRGGPVARVTSMARPRSGTLGPDMTSGLLGHVRLSQVVSWVSVTRI